MTEPDPLLDEGEAARRLNVSERTLRRWRRLGLIDAVRVGPRMIRYEPEAVEAMKRKDAA